MVLRSGQTAPRRARAAVLSAAFALLASPWLSSCHSPYVQADIHNSSGQPISVLEVDYPSASFGTDALPANSDFTYRFKIQGSGPTKVLWTDTHHKDHSVAGPVLHEGQQGTLHITITQSGAVWQTHLQP